MIVSVSWRRCRKMSALRWCRWFLMWRRMSFIGARIGIGDKYKIKPWEIVNSRWEERKSNSNDESCCSLAGILPVILFWLSVSWYSILAGRNTVWQITLPWSVSLYYKNCLLSLTFLAFNVRYLFAFKERIRMSNSDKEWKYLEVRVSIGYLLLTNDL